MEGRKYLLWLQREECPNFRVYKDYLVDALDAGKYTELNLGATKIDVLKLALFHARKAVRPERQKQLRFGEQFVNDRIKDELIAQLNHHGATHHTNVKEVDSVMAA